jgi:hypothetical protein
VTSHAYTVFIFSLLDHWKTGGLSNRLWQDQIGDSQKEPVQDYTEDGSVQLAEAFNGVGGSVRTGIIVQHCDTFWQ